MHRRAVLRERRYAGTGLPRMPSPLCADMPHLQHRRHSHSARVWTGLLQSQAFSCNNCSRRRFLVNVLPALTARTTHAGTHHHACPLTCLPVEQADAHG